jgi:hypothetical protein
LIPKKLHVPTHDQRTIYRKETDYLAGEKAKTCGSNLGCPEILEYCGWRWVDGFDLQKWGMMVWYTTNWAMNNSGYDLDMGQIGHSGS